MMRTYKHICVLLLAGMLIGGCRPASPITSTPTPTIQRAHTPLPELPTATTAALISGLTHGLEGLDFDAFIEASYQKLLSRDPETVLELGLAQVFHTPTDQLTDISDEYIKQTQALEVDILSLLNEYDRASLTPEQQLTYDIYAWYLGDRVEGQAFMYDDYPVNPTVLSLQADLLLWFTDLRPVTTLQEARDYIACLSQMDTKLAQLVDGLRRREENGAILPAFLLNYMITDLNSIAKSPAQGTPFYTSFEEKISAANTFSTSDRETLLSEAAQAIHDAVLPGYQALVEYLKHLLAVASNDAGVWKFPDGEAYYAYLLKHYTSTELSADQIHELGLEALERIHADMRVIFDQLNYPQEESIPKLFERVAADSGLTYSDQILQKYEQLITAMDQRTGEVFDLRPSIGVIVVGDPMGGFYTAPALDGSRPGMFYAQNTGVITNYSMPTLAYHEAIPGHHTQIAIAQQLDLPSFRRGADITAYTEGWALYAERLAYEMGVYENDPYGNLGRLQAEAYRAARLVVDTGLHSMRWTFSQAVDFMVDNTGMPRYVLESEVSRYISVPGQATAYYMGYTKIMELRQEAMDALGDQFDLKEFHNLVLGSGAMPLDVLEQVVDEYIQSKVEGG